MGASTAGNGLKYWKSLEQEPQECLFFKLAVEALISQQFLLYNPSSYSLIIWPEEHEQFGKTVPLVCTLSLGVWAAP